MNISLLLFRSVSRTGSHQEERYGQATLASRLALTTSNVVKSLSALERV